MEKRMDCAGYFQGSDPRPESKFPTSPTLLPQQLATPPKKWKNPLVTPRWRLFCAGALLIICAGVVFTVIKLHVPSGREKWSHQIGETELGPSQIKNGIVYTGNFENTIYALSADSGQVIWSNQLGNYTDASDIMPIPVVSNGIVYANSQDCSIYALDARTGHTLWSYKVVGCIMPAPTVANGMVYVGSEEGVVYALDAKSGHKIWSYQTENFLDASVVEKNGLVYITGAGDDIYALDAVSGRERWVRYANDAYSPTIVNGLVYAATNMGDLYAYNATTGRLEWLTQQSAGYTSEPVVVGNTIYVYSFAGVFALDRASGKERWFHRMPGTLSAPAVINGIVYVGTAKDYAGNAQDQKLYALDAASGNEQWFYQLKGGVYSTPAVSNGVVYVSASDGRLYALLPPG